jgi:hypothetical protein
MTHTCQRSLWAVSPFTLFHAHCLCTQPSRASSYTELTHRSPQNAELIVRHPEYLGQRTSCVCFHSEDALPPEGHNRPQLWRTPGICIASLQRVNLRRPEKKHSPGTRQSRSTTAMPSRATAADPQPHRAPSTGSALAELQTFGTTKVGRALA